MTHYAQMVLLSGSKSEPLVRVPLTAGEGAGGFSEDWLQDLMFKNPAALPVNEIDPSCGPLIPLCREFNTPAGPIRRAACKILRPIIAEQELVA